MGSRAHVKVVRDQFSDKHKQMAKDPIRFLRGIFYRWTQVWSKVCSDLARAHESWPLEICTLPASEHGGTALAA